MPQHNLNLFVPPALMLPDQFPRFCKHLRDLALPEHVNAMIAFDWLEINSTILQGDILTAFHALIGRINPDRLDELISGGS